MKFFSRILGLATLGAASFTYASFSELEQGFDHPFGKVPTACYWYWLSGNISAEGVRKDIQAMKRGGIDRAFIGDVGGDGNRPGKVRTFTPEWKNALTAAFDEAAQDGVELGLFNSPGWSQSGGPWVNADSAMRRFAIASKILRPGDKAELPPPPEAGDPTEFRDIALLAYPLPQDFTGLLTADSNLVFKAQTPFTARSLSVAIARAGIAGSITLEARTTDGTWHKIAETAFSRRSNNPNCGFDPTAPVILTFPATTATSFRLGFTQTLGPVTPLPLASAELRSAPSLADLAGKTFAKMLDYPLPKPDDYHWPQEPVEEPGLALDPQKYRVVTPSWSPTDGEWVVFRVGAVPTRARNASAVPEATGYEIDKMSEQHIRTHFNAYLGKLLELPRAREAVKFAVLDSYEVGGQNYTDDFRQRFQSAFGYDPLPYFPVFAGAVVGSREQADRFLWDVRRFVADEVAYRYVGGLRKVSNEHGLRTWLECYGHWGFCGEFLQYGGQSDCVAGEYWVEGSLGDIENRAASSCAHIYGKREVWSESLTATARPYGRGPVELKTRLDRFFCEGINANLLHLYVHQPDDRQPGFHAWFGGEYHRHNTWFEHFDLFTGYLKRCNFLLQQGLNVADIAYFIGDDAPVMTGHADPAPPAGRQFDFINAEVLIRDAKVDDRGRIVLPHGTAYQVLVLPKRETIRPETLRALARLAEDGAMIIGSVKPVRSPSLSGYPTVDAEVAALADQLWREGKIRDLSLEDALSERQSKPDCRWDAKLPLCYVHRTAPEAEIYFLANQSAEALESFEVTFRDGAQQPPELWDAQTGERRPAPHFRGTTLTLALAPRESVFVLFPKNSPTPPKLLSSSSSTSVVSYSFSAPWTLTFESDPVHRGPAQPVQLERLINLADSPDPAIRYYAGKIVYRTKFTLSTPPPSRLLLSLGDVQVTARVKLNGKNAGGVCFEPFTLPVGELVHQGENELEIEVENLWVNRLIGDAKLPAAERPTWSSLGTYGPDTPLRMSGLIGPVELK